jgi:ribosomal-protein-alanine N-acetyltransferase
MSRGELSIRPARLAEAAEIAAMSRELIEYGLRWAWTPERVARSVHDRATHVIVARVGGRLAGFAIMRYGDDEARLDLLGVVEDRRRRGVGRALVAWLEKCALVAGITTIRLEVRAGNAGARAFYRRLGYRDVEYLDGYYQGREAAIRMGRRIGVRHLSTPP